ncbi:MAG: GNAT family N-acetyltransferase [Chloroflexota bacterium]
MDTYFPPALSHPDPKIRVRQAHLQDVEWLHRHCWPDQTRQWVYDLIQRARQQYHYNRGYNVVITGDRHVPIVGYGQVTLWTRRGTRIAEISDLVVMPDQRGQGLGTALIQHLVRAAREMQAVGIEIGAALSNPRALTLYRRLGFVDSYTVNVRLTDTPEPVRYLTLELSHHAPRQGRYTRDTG